MNHSLHCIGRLLPSKVWLGGGTRSELQAILMVKCRWRHLLLLLCLIGLHAHRLAKRGYLLRCVTHEVVGGLGMAPEALIIHPASLAHHAHLLAVVVAILIAPHTSALIICRCGAVTIIVI